MRARWRRYATARCPVPIPLTLTLILTLTLTRYARPIVTEVKAATAFWPAENYHQRYLQKGGQSAEKNAPEKVRCYG